MGFLGIWKEGASGHLPRAGDGIRENLEESEMRAVVVHKEHEQRWKRKLSDLLSALPPLLKPPNVEKPNNRDLCPKLHSILFTCDF